MPISWNEIRDRAVTFSREWSKAESERADSQTFWNEFFNVFGISRKRVAIFEKQVELSRVGKKLRDGRIDAFWKGVLLIEHKSAGQNLDRAFEQATGYFDGLSEKDLPRYILVSDFNKFRLFDTESGMQWEFPLKELHKNIKRFSFIAGYQAQEVHEQDPVNVQAAERMGKLHDQLQSSGYDGHSLEVYLVRLLFCLFADDTGIFPREALRSYLDARTTEDGSDLGMHLHQLFQVLNTQEGKRQKTLDEDLEAFPYVNGRLFEEILPVASFNSAMREALTDCAELDWSKISPAVFGALFQSVMDKKARRNLGAHYTSETNILKLIKPLFLDELWDEFNAIKKNTKKLLEFHVKLRTLTFFDPACGCGNFLVIAYRELRLLELEILRATRKDEQSEAMWDLHSYLTIDVDQFYGIEIEEFPSQIAQVALWLMDHQMNLRAAEEFGMYFARIPLKTTPHITFGNALRLDWEAVVPKERVPYILGNPPFVGAKLMKEAQRADAALVCREIDSAGLLDYVASWYVKAVHYLKDNSNKCAFVSTNSIVQGEQVGVLFGWLLSQGIKIHFAHRTFQWTNEATGIAAVHCVIIGFGLKDNKAKTIFEYEHIRGEPHAVNVRTINPYLVEAPNVVLPRRTNPICNVPLIGIGNKPVDGGYYLFSKDEKDAFLLKEPGAKSYFRKWIGAKELLNGFERWCLLVSEVPPHELRKMPHVLDVIDSVRRYRLGEIANKSGTREPKESGPAESTKVLAAKPTEFHVTNIPVSEVLTIPRHSSETRSIVPMGYYGTDVLIGDACLVLNNVSLFHFGVLASSLHNAWIRYTCGRIKNDYRYSAEIVYNNYPWPRDPSEKQIKTIEGAAQGILDTRAKFPNSSLADLYDPLTTPPALTSAHQALDRAVDAAYGRKSFSDDGARVAFLFELYLEYTTMLPSETAKPKAKKKSNPLALR